MLADRLTVVANIDETWAKELAHKPLLIDRYNYDNARNIQREIDLSQLGGLVIACSEELYGAEEVRRAGYLRSIIDLAFGKTARVTYTKDLLAAAVHTDNRSDLTISLLRRLPANRHHDYNEPWFLPQSALRISGSSSTSSV